jgi:Outer membrane lipoprotein Slp family
MGRSTALLASLLLTTAQAADYAPNWRNTVEEDLLGPRVDLTAEVVSQVPDGDYTCFLLSPYYFDGAYGYADDYVMACNPGYFTQSDFAPGRVLGVTGNLGAATPRRIGSGVYRYPLIAGAIIKPRPGNSPYYGHHYPYYDPYYDPYWQQRPFYRGPW